MLVQSKDEKQIQEILNSPSLASKQATLATSSNIASSYYFFEIQPITGSIDIRAAET
jgi:hypothetical protein